MSVKTPTPSPVPTTERTPTEAPTLIASTTPTSPPTPTARRRRRRPWLSIVAILGGLLLLASAGLWKAVAVDALVKFPTDVELQPRYEGTLTTFIDPSTYAPLSTPTEATLGVDRTVTGVPEESTDDRVLVRETFALTIAGAPPTEQVHQYVMDRSTNANVADPKAWAYEPANVLDRTGAYWLALPMGTDGSAAVTMFKDEIGASFQATPAGVTEEVDGLELIGFDGVEANVPVTDAYLAAISGTVNLPSSLTFEQLKPSLVAAGVPVDEALAALIPIASPEDIATLLALTGQPIALEYVDTFRGRTFIEPDTGAVVDAQSIVETVSVRPTGDSLPSLLAVLERYSSQPAVAQAIASMQALADEPLPVFEYRYSQTSASVEEVASWVADQRDQLQLAERTVPMALAIGGGVLLLLGSAGLVLAWRRSR